MKIMKMIVPFIFVALITSGYAIATQDNSRDYVVIEASGILITDSSQVGDEQGVPAVMVGQEVWSLEFTSPLQEKQALSLGGKHVIVSGTPKILYSEVGGILRFIVVERVMTLR